MTTRLRAGPIVAMIAIIATTALSPLNAAATPNQTAIIAYGTAPNSLVPEVTSSPTVAWMNVMDAATPAANVVFGTNYTAASVSTRAAPFNTATVTNSTVDAQNLVLGAARAAPLAAQNNINIAYSAAGNASNDFKTNLVIENTRVAPATNDKKIAATWMIDAKKTAASYGAIDGA